MNIPGPMLCRAVASRCNSLGRHHYLSRLASASGPLAASGGRRILPSVVRLQDASFASSSEKKWSFNPMSMAGLDQESQFRKEMEDIAAISQWSLGAYCDQLGKITGSIRAKVTAGVFGSKEVADARQSEKVAQGLIAAAGRDASVETLKSLTRLDKLKICNDAGVSEETLQNEIFKFEQTHTIFRLIKELQKSGKELPTSSEEMRSLMQVYGPKFLTTTEKKRMRKIMMKRAKNGRGLPGSN